MRACLAMFVGLTLMGSAAFAAQHHVPTKVFLNACTTDLCDPGTQACTHEDIFNCTSF